MPFINLTTLPTEVVDNTKCCICEKPFKHFTKLRKVKSQDPNEVDIEYVSAHPACKKIQKKMENIKCKIIKTKQTLHNLRTSQLNLEWEMFCNNQLQLDDDVDEIFTLLKEKNIL